MLNKENIKDLVDKATIGKQIILFGYKGIDVIFIKTDGFKFYCEIRKSSEPIMVSEKKYISMADLKKELLSYLLGSMDESELMKTIINAVPDEKYDIDFQKESFNAISFKINTIGGGYDWIVMYDGSYNGSDKKLDTIKDCKIDLMRNFNLKIDEWEL